MWAVDLATGGAHDHAVRQGPGCAVPEALTSRPEWAHPLAVTPEEDAPTTTGGHRPARRARPPRRMDISWLAGLGDHRRGGRVGVPALQEVAEMDADPPYPEEGTLTTTGGCPWLRRTPEGRWPLRAGGHHPARRAPPTTTGVRPMAPPYLRRTAPMAATPPYPHEGGVSPLGAARWGVPARWGYAVGGGLEVWGCVDGGGHGVGWVSGGGGGFGGAEQWVGAHGHLQLAR